ncbi:serine/threonine-protein kinase [Actinomadura gamaensis]|uniref:Serine/threonine-protein kinase n=1 Tax=Actinomadura gamaensis TaxID=1763541 RepID=A0ABV9U0A8_9ACTN
MQSLSPSDPRRVAGIELHGRLGEGGMGQVFFGVTPDGVQVAVKIVHKQYAGREDIRARFDREIAALGMVQGPRVASLIAAAGPDDEQPWLAMEYVRGLTLRDFVSENGPLEANTGAALGDLLAEGLGAIHEAGLLHRDLKPANILLAHDGPKIIDFGLVSLGEALNADAVELTTSGATLGTPVTMSPEQVSTPRNLTPAADVYSLGASLLFALTAHYPYQRPQLPALMWAITDPNTAPDLSGLPPELVPVISGMIGHEASDRLDLDDVRERFRHVLASAGLTLGEALVRLTDVTFVARPSDPPADVDPPPQPPRHDRPPRTPTPVVERLASRLCSAYRRDRSL